MQILVQHRTEHMKTPDWQEYLIQVGLTLLTLLLHAILRRTLARLATQRAISNAFDDIRVGYIKRIVKVAALVLLVVALGIIWEISLEGLSVYIASFLTIVGVGLFATWSIVSNITASVILFFFFPFKIGSKVKIIDGDNSAEGEVVGLSLFSISIKREDGHIVYYPNNLAIQKSIVHLD